MPLIFQSGCGQAFLICASPRKQGIIPCGVFTLSYATRRNGNWAHQACLRGMRVTAKGFRPFGMLTKSPSGPSCLPRRAGEAARTLPARSKPSRPRYGCFFLQSSKPSSIRRSSSWPKSRPMVLASRGTRLVEVMPGKVLTSSRVRLSSGPRIRSALL